MMRNLLLPILFIILPIGMINMMPRAANQEVKGLTYCVIDHDHSPFSQRMIQKISASQYFTLTGNVSTYEEALHEMEAGNADFTVEIEPDFERSLIKEGSYRFFGLGIIIMVRGSYVYFQICLANTNFSNCSNDIL